MVPQRPMAQGWGTGKADVGAETPRSTPDDDDPISIAALSFMPLTGSARSRNEATIGPAYGTTAARTRGSSAARGLAQASGDGVDVERPGLSRYLLVACAFAAGAAAAVIGNDLLRSDLLLGTYPHHGASARVAIAARGARTGAEALPPAAASLPAARSLIQKLPDGSDQTKQLTQTEGAELTALKKQFERELAENRLDQPVDDNALETYRRIAKIASDDPKAMALGERLSAAFWSLATHARSSGQWDDALHYFVEMGERTQWQNQ